MRRRIIIIGGGVAGLAASALLTEREFHTTIIERRARLGGRASSFDDPATGQTLDNCQHVLLGCCTALLDLYRRLGVQDQIRFTDVVAFADETGRRGELRSIAGLGPLHLGPALFRFPLLSAGQKVQIAGAMAAIKLIGAKSAEGMDDLSFGNLLRRWGQSKEAISRFWDPVVSSALNAPAERASARYALKVFQEGFLRGRDNFRMGVPAGRLADLYERAPAGRIIRDQRVVRIDSRGPRGPAVEMGDGQRIEADAVIIAAGPDSARRLLADLPGLGDLCAKLDQFQYGAIIGAHLLFDRPVMPEAHLALMGTTTQWLFRHDQEGRHVHAVISAADAFVQRDQVEIARLIEADVRRVLPNAAGAALTRVLIVKEKRATFSPLPGVDRLRPPQRTALPWLFLAGDYTQTGWPGTMEGAARSGYLAAEAITTMPSSSGHLPFA